MDQKEKLTNTQTTTDAEQPEPKVVEEPLVSGNGPSEAEAATEAEGENTLLSRLGLGKKHKKQIEELEQRLELLSKQLAETEDKYLRLYAEFENYKKRLQRERTEILRLAGSDIILTLLPVLDDFSRALKQMESSSDPMTEGVRLIFQKLKTALEHRGLKAMQSIGQPYSPDLHEAISEVDAGEEQRGKVIDEVECGYYLNDRIIRHAKVVVGK